MKKLAVLAVAGLATSSALAQTIRAFGGNFRDGQGGEFLVQTGSGSAGLTGLASDVLPADAVVNNSRGAFVAGGEFFMTFCLELDEPLTFGVEYDVQASDSARDGGLGGPSPDPINAETAYLYTNFRRGTLATAYDYTGSAAGRAADGMALQDAIWAFEEEIGVSGLSGKALDFYNEALNAVSSGAWVGIGNVRALNTTRIDSTGALINGQDVLTIIPLPTGSALALVGLAGVSIRRRR